jgi:hypothetical protein
MKLVSSLVCGVSSRSRVAGSLALARALAAGIAYAAIPDSGGVIHACFKSNNGQVRLVGSAADCNPQSRRFTGIRSARKGRLVNKAPQDLRVRKGQQA